MSSCWTLWRMVSWLTILKICQKQVTKINSHETLKRVQTEVSRLSSLDDESMKSKITKRSKVTSSNWPRFLNISSTEDGALTKLSSFAVHCWFGW